MSYKFNPITGKLDLTGGASATGDYLPLAGGTLTGDVDFPANGYVMRDSNGLRWRVTVSTDGTLTTTALTEGAIGTPWLFYFGTI
jgi:hypothetical protein